MPGPYTDPLFKSEDAVAVLIDAMNLSLTIGGVATPVHTHKGGADEKMQVPFISILAEDARESTPRRHRNFAVRVKLEIWTSIDDVTREQRRTLAGSVSDRFAYTQIKADLNAAGIPDFTVLDFMFDGVAQHVQGRRHGYTIDFRLEVMGHKDS